MSAVALLLFSCRLFALGIAEIKGNRIFKILPYEYLGARRCSDDGGEDHTSSASASIRGNMSWHAAFPPCPFCCVSTSHESTTLHSPTHIDMVARRRTHPHARGVLSLGDARTVLAKVARSARTPAERVSEYRDLSYDSTEKSGACQRAEADGISVSSGGRGGGAKKDKW
ncbi:hypothetical protein C8J57DRAFT_1230412 [Mycena rebaudengoi]|nr:hypothetical protein C8J57DRAFT_1230412 [Mycena rebaudengoi]